MKCLPVSKVAQARGVGLHDWHAEALVIRAFNRLLLDECHREAKNGPGSSPLLRLRTEAEQIGDGGSWQGQPFALRNGITLHMYCSQTPCMLMILFIMEASS
jgi:tRNA-specific adenosine deaminase 1